MTRVWNPDNGDGTYTNPVLYADYSDPDAVRVGSDYYMVASSFSNAPGLPVLHSKDLVNWTLVNYALKKLPAPRYEKAVHGCGVWAPSIRYHEGLYYICFPMPDEGLYMCTAADPCGEWSEPVMIYEGAGRIDPCPFWDDDGKAYLVSGVAKSRTGYKSVLHVQEMRPDGMGLIGEPVPIFDGNENDQVTIEGPKFYKRNGWYYILAPAGGVKTGWQTVLRSRNIFGPYEYRVIMRQGDTDINGPHQGAWVDTVTGEDWFLHFQDVYAAGRIVHLQPMHWENDWPVIGIAAEGNEYGEPVRTYRKPDVEGTGASHHDVGDKDEMITGNAADSNQTSLDRDKEHQELKWQWNANHKESWGNMLHGRVTLNAIKRDSVYGDIPNLLLKKWEAPEFDDLFELDLSDLEESDEAGVISMGMEYGLVSFKKAGGRLWAVCVYGWQHFGRILCESTEERITDIVELPSDIKTMYVKYVVERTGSRDLNSNEKDFPEETVSIYYSLDREEYTKAIEMKSVPGRWVGVKYGVFCVSDRMGSGGKAYVT